MPEKKKKTIVIIGGGAGGLELVARLCDKHKKNKLIEEIILIDKELKHVWKPLLHQVAVGTYSLSHDAIDYISYAYEKGFTFLR